MVNSVTGKVGFSSAENAAAALLAAGRADSLAEAMPLAAASIDSGAARRKLEKLVEFSIR